MALDPKRLIELLRIAEHGSYTRAAAAQGISQPALSNSIAVLEKELGVRVLGRTRHGATPTEFGRVLITHAEALESLLTRASDDIQLKKLGGDIREPHGEAAARPLLNEQPPCPAREQC